MKVNMMKKKPGTPRTNFRTWLCLIACLALMTAAVSTGSAVAKGLTGQAISESADTTGMNAHKQPRGLLVAWPGTEGAILLIAAENDSIIYRDTPDEVLLQLLTPGTYIARISKTGYRARSVKFEITERGRTDLNLDLSGNEGRFSGNRRYWVIGAAAAIAAGSAILLINNQSGTGTAGFPPPPGRP